MTTKKALPPGSIRAEDYFRKKGYPPLTLGSLLEALRKCEEWSQTKMAKKLGISKSHLCDIEKNRKAVRPAKAASYARKLGYSETQFIELALEDSLRREGLNYTVDVKEAA